MQYFLETYVALFLLQVDDYVTSSSRFLNAAPGRGTEAVTNGKDRVADFSRKVRNIKEYRAFVIPPK